VGELGHELFSYQGWLRQKSKEFDHTTIITTAGKEHLYEDFADEIHLFDGGIPDAGKGTRNKQFQYEDPYEAGPLDLRIPPNTRLMRFNWKKEQQCPSFYKQDFVKYGTPREPNPDIYLFHIRSTEKCGQSYKNWDWMNWYRLAIRIKAENPDAQIYCIGSKQGAQYLDLNGEENPFFDFRDRPLKELAELMSQARLLISPSSGPVHFAALCGCPTVTWFGCPLRKGGTRRYTTLWNPFGSPVEVLFRNDWQPSVEDVFEAWA